MPYSHARSAVVLSVISLFLFTPTICLASEQKVKLKSMVGTVQVRPIGNAMWRSGRIGMVIKARWDVRTFMESSAELEYDNGTILRMGENSLVTLSSLDFNEKDRSAMTKVKVPVGQVWGNIKKCTSTNSRFDFETPTAVASIRGTRLGINVRRGRTAVDVYEGEVEVRNRGSGRSVQVNRENRAVVTQGAEGVEIVNFENLRQRPGQVPLEDPFEADSTAPSRDTTGTPPDSADLGQRDSTAGALELSISLPADRSIVTQSPVLIRGRTSRGAVVTLAGKEAAVAADGSFSDFVDVTPGDNTIQVAAMRGEEVANVALTVAYHPPLFLNVTNIIDNMEVVSHELQLEVELTEGAEYSVNGVKGAVKVTLARGSNQIVVAVWDRWNNRTEKTFLVNYRPVAGFALRVVAPKDNATVTAPMIPVVGSTSPGTRVTINGNPAVVNAGGFFSVQVPIPDEARDYVITVVARSKEGEEKSVERTVTYTPPHKPLDLVISSPAPGQVIKQSSIHVSGKTSPGATVKVNGRPAVVSATGILSMDLQVNEKDIGTFGLEIIASRDDKEMTKTISVKIDINSPQINTSKPRIQVTGLGRQAIRTAQLPLQVFDQTADDQIAVTVTNNGITDKFTLEPGDRETIVLNEGKNMLSVTARDLAGNPAAPIQSTIYYLPGPMEISLIEPPDNPITIDDLPPWPGKEKPTMNVRFRLEIKDNIGTVPESIKYCRVTSSSGQTVVLKNERNYYYYGDVPVGRGNTVFTIQVEDWAGNIQQKRVEARISQ